MSTSPAYGMLMALARRIVGDGRKWQGLPTVEGHEIIFWSESSTWEVRVANRETRRLSRRTSKAPIRFTLDELEDAIEEFNRMSDQDKYDNCLIEEMPA
jgi:hypothetical protein